MAAKPTRKLILATLIAVGAGLLVWWAQESFEGRHWRGYREAGRRAYERGNYEWAEKWFKKALKVAEDLGPHDPRVRQSLADLVSAYRAQGRTAAADSALTRAKSLGRRTR